MGSESFTLESVMEGMIKQGLGTVIGNAGEYLVVGELLKRGVVAAPAPRNAPGFDVLVSNGRKSTSLRVKTKTPAANSWVWIAKQDRTIFKDILEEGDFTVLVDLKGRNESPDYYVVPTKTLQEQLRDYFQRWLHSPGRGGRQRNPNNRMYRFGDQKEQWNWLNECRGSWQRIIDFLNKP